MSNQTQAPERTDPLQTRSAPLGRGAGTRAWCGPLFIVGMPRSGTKLLRGLLNQHPYVHVPDIETDFLPFLARWVREHGEPEADADFEKLYGQLRHATYFSMRATERGAFLWCEWRRLCAGRFDVAGLFEGFIRYETGLRPESGGIWGDKSPAHIRHVDLLLGYFPDARVVHIVRDVRDNCVSIRNAWGKDIRRAAAHWGRDVALAHQHCVQNPHRCLEVLYEDLLRDPERELRRLCSFLGVEFMPVMMQLRRPAENLGDATGHSKILRNNFEKFATRLTRREIVAVESLALNTMRLMGYETLYANRQRRLGALREKLLRFKDAATLVLRHARKLGVLGAFRFHSNHARMSN